MSFTSPWPEIAGGVVSWTVTVNDFCVLFPAASCAVQVTLVAPKSKCPGSWSQPRLVTPTASEAGTVYETSAPVELVASTVMLPGTTRSGAVVSTTVTLNDCGSASVAVQFTWVVPTGNGEPALQFTLSSAGVTETA